MVTVANLNQPAPPLNDIVVELSVPISFGVSVISAESALPFTLRAEGNDETMQEINTLLIALDKTWDDDLLPLCSQIFRRDIRASSELTQAEAVKALGFLKQKATEQKVAA